MAFWSEQCPARGAGLDHAHWDLCSSEGHPGEDSGHLPYQCCHCRGYASAFKSGTLDTNVGTLDLTPQIDVQERMRALGIEGSWDTIRSSRPHEKDTGMEDIRAQHDDDTPVEPKATTGTGPDGRADGKGRGELTGRQMLRLMRWKDYIKYIGGDDAPD